MRQLRGAFVLLAVAGITSACSVGTLDLTMRNPQRDMAPYQSSLVSVSDSASQSLDLAPYAEQGFEDYVSQQFNSSQWSNEILFNPKSGEVIRRALKHHDYGGGYYGGELDCSVTTRGVATKGTSQDCPAGTLCLDVNDAVVSERQGANPCGASEHTYSLRIDRGRGTASVVDDGSTLERRSYAFDGPWAAVAGEGAPPALVAPVAYSVGTQVLVWGRMLSGSGFAGGLYDLQKNTWTAMSTTGAPETQASVQPVWTGEKLIVITSGGGAAFDPKTNVWTPLKKDGAPQFTGGSKPGSFVAAFGGGKIYVWGTAYGASDAGFVLGAIYDVAADAWKPIGTHNAPVAPDFTGAIWTGMELLVWSPSANGKGFYYPDTDTWQAVDFGQSSTEQTTTQLVRTDKEVLAIAADSNSESAAFDPQTGQWRRVYLTDLPRRSGVTPQIVAGQIFAYGGSERGPDSVVPTGSSTGSSESHPASSDDKKTAAAYALGGYFYDYVKGKSILLPAGPTAPAGRSNAAVVLVGARLFVWGGCGREYNGICEAYRNDGAIGALMLP